MKPLLLLAVIAAAAVIGYHLGDYVSHIDQIGCVE